MLQMVAAILLLWFPIKDFLDTEVKKGLLSETIHPKWEWRPDVTASAAVG